MTEQDIAYSGTGKFERQPGEELLAALHSLLQNIRVHQENNILVIKCIQRIMEVVGKYFDQTDEITIQIAKGKFYINDMELPYRRSSSFLIGKMLEFMESRELLGIRFYPALLLVPSNQIVAFARHLHKAALQKQPMDWLVLRLQEDNLNWVALLQQEVPDSSSDSTGHRSGGKGERAGSLGGGFWRRVNTETDALADNGTTASEGADLDGSSEDGSPDDIGSGEGRGSNNAAGAVFGTFMAEMPGQRSPRRLYAYALAAMREVAAKISGNQRTGIRNAVRVIQNMVEEITIQEQPLLLAMSTIKVYDDYTFAHSVNVSIMSMFFGKKIGANKETLECLGISGLFHDLGKVLVPAGIVNKDAPLTEEEFQEICKHPLNSARLILRLRATAKRKSGIIIPPLEHHLRFDLKGYPQIGWTKPQTLCGRILSICDYFDALTSPRVYRTEAYSADRALGLMLGNSGSIFDPLLLKVFINIMGVYPIGTLLELDNGEIGLVSRSPDSEVKSRPWVLLLYPDGQGGFVKGGEIDLAAMDKNGSYRRSVLRSANPAVFNIQPAEFLT